MREVKLPTKSQMEFDYNPICPDGAAHYYKQVEPLSYFWRCKYCGQIVALPTSWTETDECTVLRRRLPARDVMISLICEELSRLRAYAKLTNQVVSPHLLSVCDKNWNSKTKADAIRTLSMCIQRL